MTLSRLLTVTITLFIIGVSIWLLARGIEHMLDPCRTYDLQRMNTTCR